MTNILSVVAHRPYPLPADPWRMAQRWNDLLFAHWPIRPDAIARLLPPGLEVDRFDGDAWVGVVPFWMNKVRTRTAGEACITIPSAKTFSELNLRTYVRSRASGLRGVYFFSLDAVSALAVLGARLLFHLPYFLASMARQSETDGTLLYTSKRLLTARNPCFKARYRALGKVAQPAAQRTLEYFLTERYCLFTPNRGRLLVGHIHHLPWPLQPAEAEILVNEIPKAHRITLPDQSPVLHFAKQLEVYIWSLREDRQDRQFKSPITP